MKYSKAQLNAISRSYTQKRAQEIRAQLELYGVMEYFAVQTKYKTERGFLNAIKRGNVSALVEVWEKWTASNKGQKNQALGAKLVKLGCAIQNFGGEEFAHFGY